MYIKLAMYLTLIYFVQVYAKNKYGCKCPEGFYGNRGCEESDNSESQCLKCPSGTFNNRDDDSSSCAECSSCEITQITVKTCSSTKDTVCGCPKGKVWSTFGADGYCVDE